MRDREWTANLWSMFASTVSVAESRSEGRARLLSLSECGKFKTPGMNRCKVTQVS